MIGASASEGILIARTAAVWGNSKKLFWLLITLLVIGLGAVALLIFEYSRMNSPSDPSVFLYPIPN
jgi:hypothetical protein